MPLLNITLTSISLPSQALLLLPSPIISLKFTTYRSFPSKTRLKKTLQRYHYLPLLQKPRKLYISSCKFRFWVSSFEENDDGFQLLYYWGNILAIERRKSRKVLRNLRSKLTLLPAEKQDNAPRKMIQAMISSLSVPALLYGRRVRVIERDLTEPDRIVGELLQPGGYLKLAELGLEDCVEEIDAQRVLGYALFKDGRNTKLSYTLEKFHADVAGRSFHNGRFIRRMREKAATLPKEQLGGVQYKAKDGQELRAYAPLTIVCDGCFSNLRRTLCNPKVKLPFSNCYVDVPSCFVGLILENCKLPFPNHGHVILADPSPILFYPISSTEVRCLVDVPGKKVPSLANGEMANYLKTMVAPQVPPELCEAFIAAVDKVNIRTI
ncbi:Squalene monooxygenase isoform 4 [Gossypium australe]|uniref:Squalene monooxygenase n=1 Tax=Gossypium australe TaxID=47621 RepID=A0A5B6VYL4_9ROSI|nr:Squalene monooxygenase isoform 4 [Gossypium australe]